jgi:hypothetical protein
LLLTFIDNESQKDMARFILFIISISILFVTHYITSSHFCKLSSCHNFGTSKCLSLTFG